MKQRSTFTLNEQCIPSLIAAQRGSSPGLSGVSSLAMLSLEPSFQSSDVVLPVEFFDANESELWSLVDLETLANDNAKRNEEELNRNDIQIKICKKRNE
jgi:hypothetical protein